MIREEFPGRLRSRDEYDGGQSDGEQKQPAGKPPKRRAKDRKRQDKTASQQKIRTVTCPTWPDILAMSSPQKHSDRASDTSAAHVETGGTAPGHSFHVAAK